MISPTLILLIWPFVCIVFFVTLRFDKALIISVVAGYLFLPDSIPDNLSIDLPLLPPLSKSLSISVAALVGWVICRKNIGYERQATFGFTWPFIVICCIVLIVGPFFTSLTNREEITIGNGLLPALDARDALSLAISTLVALPPFFLAMKYLTDEESHRELLKLIVAFALLYSLLVLVELRISPQINMWTYGYFPHSWGQQLREGGFRPVVFLKHGLWLGFFLLTATFAAFSLAAQGEDKARRTLWLLAGIWLILVLSISRNLGVVILVITFLPVLLLLPRRMQTLVYAAIALIFLFYPALHHKGVQKAQLVVSYVEEIAPERASSLAFRLRNEEQLLARANEKPIWGWGGYARNKIFDETGRDISVTDGRWIIVFGVGGWFGYIAYFGLLTIALIILPSILKSRKVNNATLCLAAVTSVNLIYLIPNSALSPIGWLFAGAIIGYCQVKSGSQAYPKQNILKTPAHTRFPIADIRIKSHTPMSSSINSPRIPYTRNLGRIEPRKKL